VGSAISVGHLGDEAAADPGTLPFVGPVLLRLALLSIRGRVKR
jgi:hypothetical protein